MSVRTRVYLACTQCNNEAWSDKQRCFFSAESAREIRSQARAEGWVYVKVENGSYWDVCPRCQRRDKANAAVARMGSREGRPR